MQLIRPDTKIDFMGRRRLFAYVSTAAVVASVVLMFFPGPKYGIDFSGGTQLQLQFGKGVNTESIRRALADGGYQNAEVVVFGDRENEFLITVQDTSPVDRELAQKAMGAVRDAFSSQELMPDSWKLSSGGDRLELAFREAIDETRLEEVLREAGLAIRPHQEGEVRSTSDGGEGVPQVCNAPVCRILPLSEFRYQVDLVGVGDLVIGALRTGLGAERVSNPERVIYVGPKVGNQLKMAALKSILFALGFIMVYIALRFDLRFAPGAVVALLHDITITLGIFVIIRHELTLPIIAALLTIVGYSLNDTIVVFDRIRENFQKLRERELSLVVNQSINETLSRTLLTSLTTLFTVGAIYVLGGGMIKDFALALIIGVFIGTYSSIFVAAPVVVYLDKKFFRRQGAV